MSAYLIEITADQIIGLNRKALEAHKKKYPSSQLLHQIVRPNDLASCIGGIFYQTAAGYAHLPIEKMAGLILYRVAQGQFFADGNKRTGLLSMWYFLENNGYKIHIDRAEVGELMWGFAPDEDKPVSPPKYTEADAIQFVFNNIYSLVSPY